MSLFQVSASQSTVTDAERSKPLAELSSPADAPLVKVTSLVKQYKLSQHIITALDQVSLTIPRGDFVALAGPSGSGKSTLLNLIGCIDQPTSGTVEVDGVEVARLQAAPLAQLRRDRLGFIFQSFNLIPVFTASENVEYPLLLQRVSAPERKERVRAALASVGLSERASPH